MAPPFVKSGLIWNRIVYICNAPPGHHRPSSTLGLLRFLERTGAFCAVRSTRHRPTPSGTVAPTTSVGSFARVLSLHRQYRQIARSVCARSAFLTAARAAKATHALSHVASPEDQMPRSARRASALHPKPAPFRLRRGFSDRQRPCAALRHHWKLRGQSRPATFHTVPKVPADSRMTRLFNKVQSVRHLLARAAPHLR